MAPDEAPAASSSSEPPKLVDEVSSAGEPSSAAGSATVFSTTVTVRVSPGEPSLPQAASNDPRTSVASTDAADARRRMQDPFEQGDAPRRSVARVHNRQRNRSALALRRL